MFNNLAKAICALTCAVQELGSNDRQTQAILKRLAEMDKKIMSAFTDVKEELGIINGTTNEIAADIDELIAGSIKPGMTEAEAAEVVADLRGLSTTLKGVAAKHPVVTPPPV